jgi:D-ribose pyranase
MKKQGVLNHRLSEVIAQMGHGDMLVVADAGLPIPPGVERIDLAVTRGLPGMLDVTHAIAGDLQVERVIVAVELVERNPGLARAIATLYPGAVQEAVTHEEFKALSRGARAVARTGEHTPYANVILVSGVTF